MKIFVRIFLSICCCILSQVNAQKTIGIFTAKVEGVKPWDPDAIQSGISGSEEAVIYMSQSLAKLDYKVIVFGDPPQGSIYSLPGANPLFIHLDPLHVPPLDIAISWRMPNIADALKKVASKVYLWPHDTCENPLTEVQIQGFDGVFWLSEWQRQQWISVNPGFAQFTQIFGNGILPEQFKPVQKRENPYACIYGSNYARGLEILLDLWPEIKREFPRATLDIYYGWKHWGFLSAAKEASMRASIADLAPLDVHEHGLVGHETLNRAYERASFWVYPCILPETFCITALRAQLAGTIPIILEGSALSETVKYGYRCFKREDYYNTLVRAFQQAEKISLEERRNMGKFILEKFTWDALARSWQEVFEGRISSEPKTESEMHLSGNSVILICVFVSVGICVVVLRRRKLSRV